MKAADVFIGAIVEVRVSGSLVKAEVVSAPLRGPAGRWLLRNRRTDRFISRTPRGMRRLLGWKRTPAACAEARSRGLMTTVVAKRAVREAMAAFDRREMLWTAAAARPSKGGARALVRSAVDAAERGVTDAMARDYVI